MTNEHRSGRPFWLNILIAFCLSTLLFVVIGVVLFVYSVRDSFYGSSNVIIWNRSGLDVHFKTVTIDDQVIWTGPALIVSPKDLKKPYLDNRRHGMMLELRTRRKLVTLKVLILNKMEEEETLSCTLDNRSPPCLFEVFYHKGRLSCGECDKHFMH
ncbi:MAG: hypothetical protein AB1733_24620 [Thermodesulfobacteriota bacterium]